MRFAIVVAIVAIIVGLCHATNPFGIITTTLAPVKESGRTGI